MGINKREARDILAEKGATGASQRLKENLGIDRGSKSVGTQAPVGFSGVSAGVETAPPPVAAFTPTLSPAQQAMQASLTGARAGVSNMPSGTNGVQAGVDVMRQNGISAGVSGQPTGMAGVSAGADNLQRNTRPVPVRPSIQTMLGQLGKLLSPPPFAQGSSAGGAAQPGYVENGQYHSGAGLTINSNGLYPNANYAPAGPGLVVNPNGLFGQSVNYPQESAGRTRVTGNQDRRGGGGGGLPGVPQPGPATDAFTKYLQELINWNMG